VFVGSGPSFLCARFLTLFAHHADNILNDFSQIVYFLANNRSDDQGISRLLWKRIVLYHVQESLQWVQSTMEYFLLKEINP
jgi:hypothetical protein